MALDDARLVHKRFQSLLQADAVYDALALAALQTRLHDGELGAVDHEGHAADFWVSHQQVDEAGHGSQAVDQAIVHVQINDICT